MNDVCLLLEGTYPYVAGGVSSWVYQLIKELPDVTFSIVYLGPHRQARKRMHYDIPNNVREFRELYLFDYLVNQEWNKRKFHDDEQNLLDFLKDMRKGKTDSFEFLLETIGDKYKRRVSLHDVVHAPMGWRILEKLYEFENQDISFIDYFWTWRFLYVPMFSLLRAEMPEARVYHSASTGYAGVLGAMAKYQYGKPFLLTEHGIYTRERKIEIAKADWIYSDAMKESKIMEKGDFFKEWWVNLFSYFSLLSYERADKIFTLYGGNRRIQIEEGADPEKIEIIPNGVDLNAFTMKKRDANAERLVIGFAGRVVPIKDVKTLIRAFNMVAKERDDVDLWILGPTDEDEAYFEECQLLVKAESLESRVQFHGKVRLPDYYPQMDVLVLTSISEGQPLVILEAYAAGVPAVSTDVGSCSELIYGKTDEDRLLGDAGIITPICDPQATASALLKIIGNENLRWHMGKVGRKRVETYYQIDDVLAAYQRHYDQSMETVAWQV